MSRKLSGHKRFRDGKWLIEVQGDHIGSYADEDKADRML